MALSAASGLGAELLAAPPSFQTLDEFAEATAISADGSVVVGGASDGVGLILTGEAWRCDGGVMSGLGVGVGPPEWVWANAVSSDGGVVVGGRVSLGGGQSYRWDHGELTTLGRLLANGVSADGSVVVGGAELFERAWRWENGVATNLGSLPGAEWGTALDVSADGSVIVGSVGGDESGMWDGSTLGVLWTPGDGARYVGDVLADDLGLDLDGWVLREVAAISDDGLTIVGNATKDFGKAEFIGAWIAHIPEPASLALLVVGALAWIGRGRSGATRVST